MNIKSGAPGILVFLWYVALIPSSSHATVCDPNPCESETAKSSWKFDRVKCLQKAKSVVVGTVRKYSPVKKNKNGLFTLEVSRFEKGSAPSGEELDFYEEICGLELPRDAEGHFFRFFLDAVPVSGGRPNSRLHYIAFEPAEK